MNILLADPDPDSSRILTDMLSAEGFTTTATRDGEEAWRIVQESAPDILIADALLPRRSGLDLARSLLAHRSQTALVLLCQAATPALQQESRTLGFRLFPRPFSAFALIDHIHSLHRRPAPRPAAPARLPQPPPATPDAPVENLRLLARLWREHSNGRLILHTPGGPPLHGWLESGGPVGPESLSLIHLALDGGQLRFQVGAPEGSGSRTLLGSPLYRAALRHAAALPIPEALLLLSSPADVDDLPLSALFRSRLSSPVHASTLLGAPPTPENSGAVRALLLLGVLRPSASASLPPTAPLPPLQRASLPPTAPLPPLQRAQVARAVPAPDRPWANPPSGVPAAPAISVDQQRALLRREMHNLQEANPWVILGIPPGSTAERIRAAAERMQARYTPLCQHNDPQIRQDAGALLLKVQDAIGRLKSRLIDDIPATGEEALPPEPSEEDPLVVQGRYLALREHWAAADRLFSRARDQDPGSADVLAWLGWCRYHNPEPEMEEREEEGLSLARLGEQFDPKLIDARLFVARMLTRSGDNAGAERRLRFILQQQPGHAEAARLLSRLPKSKP